jgi:hypothetical protein
LEREDVEYKWNRIKEKSYWREERIQRSDKLDRQRRDDLRLEKRQADNDYNENNRIEDDNAFRRREQEKLNLHRRKRDTYLDKDNESFDDYDKL